MRRLFQDMAALCSRDRCCRRGRPPSCRAQLLLYNRAVKDRGLAWISSNRSWFHCPSGPTMEGSSILLTATMSCAHSTEWTVRLQAVSQWQRQGRHCRHARVWPQGQPSDWAQKHGAAVGLCAARTDCSIKPARSALFGAQCSGLTCTPAASAQHYARLPPLSRLESLPAARARASARRARTPLQTPPVCRV